MSKRITVTDFGNGIADNKYSRTVGQCSFSKNFDLTMMRNVLFPLPGVATDSTGQTNIAIIKPGSDNQMWGLGEDGSGNGKMYSKADAASNWASSTAGLTAPAAASSTFLVEHRSKWYFARSAAGVIYSVNLDGTGASAATARTIASATFLAAHRHSKNDKIYFAYTTSSGAFIASYDGSSWADTALSSLPTNFTPTALWEYDTMLAIVGYVANESFLYLWDCDETRVTITASEPLGACRARVMNSIDGYLIIVSDYPANTSSSEVSKSVIFHAYGGGKPQIIKQITSYNVADSSAAVTINPKVNFVDAGKFFFSFDLTGNKTIHGLSSLSRNKNNGLWVYTVEQGATNDNSETSVLAAARIAGYTYFVHTSVGTITRTINSSVLDSLFAQTCIYETLVNPEMPDGDWMQKKQLLSFEIFTEPLYSAAQVVVKYRVDSTSAFSTTIMTKTATSPDTRLTHYKAVTASGDRFVSGTNIEFRIESTKGARIVGYAYEYDILKI